MASALVVFALVLAQMATAQWPDRNRFVPDRGGKKVIGWWRRPIDGKGTEERETEREEG